MTSLYQKCKTDEQIQDAFIICSQKALYQESILEKTVHLFNLQSEKAWNYPWENLCKFKFQEWLKEKK